MTGTTKTSSLIRKHNMHDRKNIFQSRDWFKVAYYVGNGTKHDRLNLADYRYYFGSAIVIYIKLKNGGTLK